MAGVGHAHGEGVRVRERRALEHIGLPLIDCRRSDICNSLHQGR